MKLLSLLLLAACPVKSHHLTLCEDAGNCAAELQYRGAYARHSHDGGGM